MKTHLTKGNKAFKPFNMRQSATATIRHWFIIIICLLQFIILDILPQYSFAQQLLAYVTGNVKRKEVPVLCFHHIRKNVSRPNELTISTDAFRADMKIG